MANEKRLIDANALKELVYRRSNNLRDGWTSPAVLLAIEAQPTVDAVEVVRCKDCKHYERFEDGIGWRCGLDNNIWERDDFCSYGERKDNEKQTD